MCENQNMEKKNEDIKFVHSQHVRILKEEDEIWISSEDLNTENSSDDERLKSKQAYKKKLKIKHRKRSSPNINVQRPSISSIPSTSRAIDERLLMPKSEDQHFKSDDSRTSDEEYSFPPMSSECLSKRLSLEDWRPMKGALNISSLEEAAVTAEDTRKIVDETSKFYDVMLSKLKSLKTCSVLKSARKEKFSEQGKLLQEEKTFKYLKNTPEVKHKLNFINKLDEEINETIDRYKVEREERLKTEFEMCKYISEHKLAQERDAEVFLKMCNFEENLQMYKEQMAEPTSVYTEEEVSIENIDTESNAESQNASNDSYKVEESNIIEKDNDDKSPDQSTNFVRRNIYAAKEGMMASYSLTDEQKTKIADILKDIDNFQLEDADLTPSLHSLTDNSENNRNENWDTDNFNYVNAFTVVENDRIRMGEINNELEKFAEDEVLNEKTPSTKEIAPVKDVEFWKKYVLDQSLKDIDAKLETLYESYKKDEEKINRNATMDEEMDNIKVDG